jgi:hypothetical protein
LFKVPQRAIVLSIPTTSVSIILKDRWSPPLIQVRSQKVGLAVTANRLLSDSAEKTTAAAPAQVRLASEKAKYFRDPARALNPTNVRRSTSWTFHSSQQDLADSLEGTFRLYSSAGQLQLGRQFPASR